MKIIDLKTVSIDQNAVYYGIITHLAPAKAEGQNPIGFIKPESEFIQDVAYSIRVARGKAKKNPENVNFVQKRSDKDTFFACAGNDYPLAIGQRVSFSVRYDSLGMLQAFNVKVAQGAPEPSAVEENPDPALSVYLSRRLEEAKASIAAKSIEAALGAYASEMPDDDDFEGVEEFLTDDEIDQDETDFSVYYDAEE